jgi:hypothetical protein
MVPHDFARDGTLGDKAFRLWIVLQSHADYDDRDCRLYQSTLATEMDCARVTVWRAQNDLVQRNLLEIESGKTDGAANIYTLIDPPEGYFTGETPLSRPRDTPYRAGETPGISPMKDKGNENQFNEIKALPNLSPVDIEPPPDIPARGADLRAHMKLPPTTEGEPA